MQKRRNGVFECLQKAAKKCIANAEQPARLSHSPQMDLSGCQAGLPLPVKRNRQLKGYQGDYIIRIQQSGRKKPDK
jgi:hypothetical protein